MCIKTPCIKLNVYWDSLENVKCVLGHTQKVECVLAVGTPCKFKCVLYKVNCELGHPVQS